MDRKQFLVGMAALAAGSVFKLDSLFAQTLIASASPSPQTTAKSDREKQGLRGPVRRTDDGIMTSEYDLNGRMISKRWQMRDGSEWVQTWKYDGDGRLLEEAKKHLPTDEVTIHSYSYDESGRLRSITNSRVPDELTVYEYDEQGRKKQIRRFDPKILAKQQGGTGIPRATFDRGECAPYSVPIGTTLTTIYNDRDEPEEVLLRDAQGQLLSRATRTFDGKGRVSEERQTTENFAVFDEQTFYTYDAQDRLIQMRSKTLFHSSEDTTRYNDHGDVSESHSVNRGPDLPPEGGFYDEENGVVKMDGEVLPIKILHEFQVSYIYHYDDYGNWTERTTSTSTGQKENLIESTQYRKLTYY